MMRWGSETSRPGDPRCAQRPERVNLGLGCPLRGSGCVNPGLEVNIQLGVVSRQCLFKYSKGVRCGEQVLEMNTSQARALWLSWVMIGGQHIIFATTCNYAGTWL